MQKTKVMSNMVKSKFAGLLRSLLRRMDASDSAPAPAARPVTSAAPLAPATPLNPAAASAPAGPTPANAHEISLPLVPIIAGLSADLRSKLMPVPLAGLTFNLPIETVTTQLAFGAVKISFGELRQLAPGVFVNSGGELDHKPVTLPLNEILPRLNPALLARRSGPKVEVAEDINGPFGNRAANVTFTAQPLKPVAPPTPPPPPPLPRTDQISVEPPAPVAPIAFTPPINFSRPAAPAAPTPAQPPARPVSPPIAPMAMAPVAPVTPPPLAPKPIIFAAPVPAPAPAVPRPEPAQPTIFAALWDLAEIWPEELRNEISHTALANVSVPLAGGWVEAGLKRGRLTMPWRQLRTLAKPSSAPSPNDDVELDLPLKVIAPLFFAAQKNLGTVRKAVKVSADIPNLFFGFPQAAPEPPAAAPKPVEKKSGESNFYVWGDEGETPKVPAPQTDFASRQAPPKEVVTRAMQLPGVAGAVVTLPDGLRVASEVPAEFNADTFAAFIPQMFERMNQSAKELRMGALNNVSFTVGNVPWRIYRVNSVYFAAFGRAGESLPAAELTRLAGELDRKKNQ
jgi:predicted regulator of Ras-like GTPase activity (Roadblock/LC7/MglB family)